MALPVIFGGLPGPIPLSDLDEDFAALGALTTIPCGVTGTNALTLTPGGGTPTIASYVNYQPFSGVVATTNTGATTAAVGSLAALNVYKDTTAGPVVLSGGELYIGNTFILIYDAALNIGTGGFHLVNIPTVVTLNGSPTSGQIAQWGAADSLGGIGVTGGGSVVLATSPALTTPDLGTPSAVNLTSATGLPVSTGLAGLGTGVGTALSQAVAGSGGIVLVTTATLTTPKTTGYVTSALPSPVSGLVGARAHVTDASTQTPAFGAVVTGGGSATLPAFCDGSAWRYG